MSEKVKKGSNSYIEGLRSLKEKVLHKKKKWLISNKVRLVFQAKMIKQTQISSRVLRTSRWLDFHFHGIWEKYFYWVIANNLWPRSRILKQLPSRFGRILIINLKISSRYFRVLKFVLAIRSWKLPVFFKWFCVRNFLSNFYLIFCSQSSPYLPVCFYNLLVVPLIQIL